MPLSGVHAARIADPKGFDTFRMEKDKFGPGIHAVWGIKGGKSEVQAIRFDAAKFDVAAAKAWLAEHDYSPLEFEPAAKGGSDMAEGAEFWIEAFKAGTWTDSAGQTDTYTLRDLDGVVAAFRALKDEHPVNLRLGDHTDKLQIAAGWVDDLKREGDVLMAKLSNVPELVKKAMQQKRYRWPSVGFKFAKEIAGRKWPIVLDHIAILGKNLPAIKGLKDLDAYSYQDATDDEVRVITLTLATDKAGKVHYSQEEELNVDELNDLKERLRALEASGTKHASEAAEFKAKAEDAERKLKGVQDERQTERRKANAETIRAYCEQQVKDKKMAPAAAKCITDALASVRSYSESDEPLFAWDTIKNYSELHTATLPNGETGLHQKRGKGAETAFDKMDKAVRAYQIKNGCTYEKAYETISLLDEDLAKEVAAELMEATKVGGEQ